MLSHLTILYLERTYVLLQVNAIIKTQAAGKQEMSTEEVAMGFIQVANETMCRPIRALTQV